MKVIDRGPYFLRPARGAEQMYTAPSLHQITRKFVQSLKLEWLRWSVDAQVRGYRGVWEPGAMAEAAQPLPGRRLRPYEPTDQPLHHVFPPRRRFDALNRS